MKNGNEFIKKINTEMEQKAIKAVIIRSVFIPAFNNKPITLNGIPYLIKGFDIFSEAFGWI